jgi:hydrocephalus-inducing protein
MTAGEETEDESKKKHTGSIFFPLPDGTANLYKLEGKAGPPKAEASSPITASLPCKKAHTVRVPVTNWLKQPQRFKVDLQVNDTTEVDKELVLRGLESIDVPPLKTKDFKLVYHPFKPGATSAKLTFTNQETGEYLFYEVQLNAGEPGEIPQIKLDAIVRQKFVHSIPIENPFNSEVTLDVKVEPFPHPAWDIALPDNITVAAQKEELLPLTLRPLLAGENAAKLTLYCSELGTYTYNLALSATEAGPEGAMHFSTDLGNTQLQKLRFTSYLQRPTSYEVSFDSEEFQGDAKVDAPAATDDTGIEVETSVTYEPSVLGDTHSVMYLKSAEGGTYAVNLHGGCVAPKPRGPYDVKGSLSLPFKNVFAEDKTFSFTVDNPCFTVGPAKKQLHEEVLQAKKEINLAISFTQGDGQSKSGKLVAASPGVPNWVYYLTGQ